MKNNLTPFPAGAGGPPKPKLPKMTIPERKLWAASHNLPDGMLLLYEDEMRTIQASTIQTVAMVRQWNAVGQALAALGEPMAFFDVVKPKLDRLKELEAGLTLANGDVCTPERLVVLLDAERAANATMRDELSTINVILPVGHFSADGVLELKSALHGWLMELARSPSSKPDDEPIRLAIAKLRREIQP